MRHALRTLVVLPFCLACATSEDVDDGQSAGGGLGGSGGTSAGGSGGAGSGGTAAGGSGGTPSGGGSGGTLQSGGGSGGTPSGGSGGTSGGSGGSGGASGGSGGASGGSGGASGGSGGASGGSGGGSACVVAGCADGNESGAGCLGARVIGRTTAAKLGGFQISANTCAAGNDLSGYDATSCLDQGRDRSWRMYLKKFEKLDVTLTQGAKCSSATSWNRVFKIYSGTTCSDQSCGKKVLCANTGAGTWSTSFVAPDDGWYVIVVDGKNGPGSGDDSGDFTLTLSLLCVFGGCEC